MNIHRARQTTDPDAGGVAHDAQRPELRPRQPRLLFDLAEMRLHGIEDEPEATQGFRRRILAGYVSNSRFFCGLGHRLNHMTSSESVPGGAAAPVKNTFWQM